MLAKTTPFTGSKAQIAGHHPQPSLPMRQVKHLPQPVVALLTHLLEKDPSDRPQTPEELSTILKVTIRALGAPQATQPPEKVRISAPAARTRRSRRGTHPSGAFGRKLLLEPWDFR